MKKLLILIAIVSVCFGQYASNRIDKAFGRLVYASETGDTVLCTTADEYYVVDFTNATAGTQGSYRMTYDETDDKLTINTGQDGYYLVVATVSCESSGNNDEIHFAIGKNGAIGTFSESHSIMPLNQVKVLTMTNVPMLNAGDYLQVFFSSNGAGDAIKIYHLNLAVIKL